MLTKNCNYCGKEITVRPSNRDKKFCDKECAGMFRRKPIKDTDRALHDKYDNEYSIAVKKSKLLALQRQNYIDELLLEQLPSTPDLKTRLELIDEQGNILE